MIKPAFLTFTGADDHTNLDDMIALDRDFPIEWGILVSESKMGTNRYPKKEFIRLAPLELKRASLHVCGGYARQVFNGDYEEVLDLAEPYGRVQVNGIGPNISDDNRIDNHNGAVFFGKEFDGRVILQTRSGFPNDTRFDWLFDKSGGRGLQPDAWPCPANLVGRIFGYAGGINEDNILDVVAKADEYCIPFYWLDMESRIRNNEDKFDIGKCRRICEKVFK